MARAGAFATLLFFVLAAPAAAESRHALVIGNDVYETVEPLEKAAADSRTVAAALGQAGFEVRHGENLARRDFNRLLQEFSLDLARGDVAFFFFAGHGVAIDGRNYLLPTDIPAAGPGQEQFVSSEAIAVDEVIGAINATGARISILVIDACRDNPFAREGTRSLGSTRGLARVAPPSGSFVLYSAGIGQAALDRLGPDDAAENSVFTRALAPLLATPGLSLTETARQVRRDVETLARTVSHDQRPAYYDEVSGDFFIAGAGDTTALVAAAAPAPQSPPAGAAAAEVWAVTRDTESKAVLEAFIGRFPDTVYADLAQARLDELIAEEEQREEPSAGQPVGTALATPPLAMSPPPPDPGRPLHYVTGLDPAGDNWLALRTRPSTGGELIARLVPETRLEVLGRSGSWLDVLVYDTTHAGLRGWAYSRYIACCREARPAAAPAATRLHYLTGLDPAGDNWLALRTAPSGQAGQRIAQMGPETLVEVVGRSGAWLEVVVRNTANAGLRGWAYSGYIACCREVPAR